MSSRTLYCEPGKHKWEHPGGRGRPPAHCPEHAPVKKKAVSYVEQARDIEKAAQQAAIKENPFIKKAKEREQATPAPEPEKAEKNGKRAHYSKPEEYAGEIVDTNSYNDAGMPGIKIHNIKRDTTGVWTCQLTVNEETFRLVRSGGWLVERGDGGWRAALPNVAAAIQARVRRLEGKGELVPASPAPAPKKTLEQVADEVVPMPMEEAMGLIQEAAANDPFGPGGEMEEAHKRNTAIFEEDAKVCELCERVQMPDDGEWAVDEGMDICPQCAVELGLGPAPEGAGVGVPNFEPEADMTDADADFLSLLTDE